MKIDLLYIDLFCGAGGTSTGVESAMVNDSKCAKVIACVNHDKNAIASHAANHPEALHFTEDIRILETAPLIEHARKMKARYPEALMVLWMSLECTNFSKAKGGQSRDADSRTLAEHTFRYLDDFESAGILFDYIQIENVVEFMSWGDIDENGKPVTMDKGRLFLRWINNVKKYGYDFDHRILDSADFGAFTSRKRFFGQFAMGDLPIAWPEPTHSKTGSQGLFAPQKKWKAVKEVLDLEDHGKSIFGREKPLADRTLRVILAGIEKAIKNREDCFLLKYYGNGNNLSLISAPAGTVTTKDRFAKVQMIFNQYGNGNVSDLETVSGTVTTNPKQNLLTFIYNPAYGGSSLSINRPAPTIVARQDKAPLSLIIVKMNEYGIVDIRKRMLKIPELKQIMGFPKDYTLIGNQAEQKKYIGNAVEVNTAKAICSALASKLHEYSQMKIA